MEWSKDKWDFQEEGETLFVDKPLDWTSFDVVKKIKTLFNVRKVGHAGTLDPKATGLLIVCTGKKTKSLDSYLDVAKEYTGAFELGVRTPSFDSETKVYEVGDFSHVTPQLLERTIKQFTGKIMQKPPMYSAVKIEGRPLYLYARKGKSINRSAREVEILDFRVTRFSPPLIDFDIICSKGTYIRTLVEDLGIALGCGCTLRSLRRTRIGSVRVEDAMTIDDLISLRDANFGNRQLHHEVSQPAE